MKIQPHPSTRTMLCHTRSMLRKSRPMTLPLMPTRSESAMPQPEVKVSHIRELNKVVHIHKLNSIKQMLPQGLLFCFSGGGRGRRSDAVLCFIAHFVQYRIGDNNATLSHCACRSPMAYERQPMATTRRPLRSSWKRRHAPSTT